MAADAAILVAVDKPAAGIVVVRVAGVVDRVTCTRLTTVVQHQLAPHPARLATAGHHGPQHILVDLGSIRYVDVHALTQLQSVADQCRGCGARLWLTGLSDRCEALPGEVAEALIAFETWPSVEAALAFLPDSPHNHLGPAGREIAGSRRGAGHDAVTPPPNRPRRRSSTAAPAPGSSSDSWRLTRALT